SHCLPPPPPRHWPRSICWASSMSWSPPAIATPLRTWRGRTHVPPEMKSVPPLTPPQYGTLSPIHSGARVKILVGGLSHPDAYQPASVGTSRILVQSSTTVVASTPSGIRRGAPTAWHGSPDRRMCLRTMSETTMYRYRIPLTLQYT